MNHGQHNLSDRLVALIHEDFQGFHPGFRGVHSQGRYYAGSFVATSEAKEISRAAHFQGDQIPITIRHSHNPTGNPWVAGGNLSMATRFYLPNGTITDLIALMAPIFPTGTVEETAALLDSARPLTPRGPPNVEGVKKFASTRPSVAAALQLTSSPPTPVSFAQSVYNALHAFRFVNASGVMRYARYHWVPVAGIVGQTPEELASRPASYFYDELESRLRLVPVEHDLVLKFAAEGDPTNDASAVWPEGREQVTVGRLSVKRPTSVEEIGDPVMMHDPTRLTDGIEPSDDPILAARRGIYEVSVAHRTGGWKGRQAAWARADVCPFGGDMKS
jgi:catalase